MPDRTFTIQLGEDERLMNLAALGIRAGATPGRRAGHRSSTDSSPRLTKAPVQRIAPISADRCRKPEQHGTAGLLPARSQRQRTIRPTRRRGTENREDRWRAGDGQQDAGQESHS